MSVWEYLGWGFLGVGVVCAAITIVLIIRGGR